MTPDLETAEDVYEFVEERLERIKSDEQLPEYSDSIDIITKEEFENPEDAAVWELTRIMAWIDGERYREWFREEGDEVETR